MTPSKFEILSRGEARGLQGVWLETSNLKRAAYKVTFRAKNRYQIGQVKYAESLRRSISVSRLWVLPRRGLRLLVRRKLTAVQGHRWVSCLLPPIGRIG